MGGQKGRTRVRQAGGGRPTAAPQDERPAPVRAEEIAAEFEAQGEPVPLDRAATRALVRVANGILARSIPTPFISQDLVREQTISTVVLAYAYRPDPRDVHARLMPDLIRSAFREKPPHRVPIRPTVEALAKVAVGLLEERTNPLGNTGKILAAGAVTDIYLAGA